MQHPYRPSAVTLAATPVATGVDWIDLLQGVKARVQEISAGMADSNHDLCESLMACALALSQVHALLLEEARHQGQLQLELNELRLSLARNSTALAGARDDAQRARHAAAHDALTLLPNRQYFRDQLHQALQAPLGHARALTVLYLDLDDFKPVNDRHGHAVGDALLRIIGTRLAHAVRAGDLVSRLGGDEFACLVMDFPDAAGVDLLARKLIDIVSAPFTVGSLELRVCPSVGIASSPGDAGTADHLLQCADAAMYRAKRTHAGVARFDPGIDGPDEGRLHGVQA